MVIFKSWATFDLRNSLISLTFPALLILPLLSLVGCTGEGGDAPIGSNLSPSPDPIGELGSDHTSSSDAADSRDEEDPALTMIPTPTGVTARLDWGRPSTINADRFYIYYRKRSLEEPNSDESLAGESRPEEWNSEESTACSDRESQVVETPPATITGLEPNTQYVFAIRAVNESESLCSNEITVVTPPTPS